MATSDQLTLLFIHGAGGTKSKWRKVREQLIKVTTHFIDLPGHGTNYRHPPASIEEYAEMLSQSIHQNTIIIGHSMGGLIGIELTAKNKNVKGLMLVASHYRLPVHQSILSKLSEGSFPESLFYASYSKMAYEELIQQEKMEISYVSPETTFRDYDCCNRYSQGRESFSQLNIPILTLYGEEDRLLPKTAKDELLNANPHADVQIIHGSGHYVMLEKPREFVSALIDFMKNVERRGG